MAKYVAMLALLMILAAPVSAIPAGDVIIGQQLVLRIRFPAGGYTIQQRADLVTQRINEVLGSNPFNPNDVRVVQQGGEWTIMIGDALIITVDKQTASINQATPEQLANMWAANLRRVIPLAKAEPRR